MKTCFGLAYPIGLAALFLVCFTGMQTPVAAAGDPGFLGVYSADDGSGKGAVIQGCVEGAPAEATGLKPGDRIISFNGKKVKSADDLIKVLSKTEAGDTVEFVFVRSGEEIFSDVTLASKKKYTPNIELPNPIKELKLPIPAKPAKPAKKAPTFRKPVFKELPKLKVEAKKAGGEKAFIGVYLGQGKNTVKIEGVIEGSPALAAGILCGDEVISVNGKEVENPEKFASMIGSMKPGKVAVFKILRDGAIIKKKVKTGTGGGQMPAPVEKDLFFGEVPDIEGDVQFFDGESGGIHVFKGIGSGGQAVILGDGGELKTAIAGCAGECAVKGEGECAGKGEGCKGCVLFSGEGEEGEFELHADKFIIHSDGEMFEMLADVECECEGDCDECDIECECDEECECEDEDFKVITRNIAIPGKEGVMRLKVVGGENGEYKIEVLTDEEEVHTDKAHNKIIYSTPHAEKAHNNIITYSDPKSGGTSYKVMIGDEIVTYGNAKAGTNKDVRYKVVNPENKVWIEKSDSKESDDHKCSCEKCRKKQNVMFDRLPGAPHVEHGNVFFNAPTALGHPLELGEIHPPVAVENVQAFTFTQPFGGTAAFDVHKCQCPQCGKAPARAQACKVIKKSTGGCSGSCCSKPHAAVVKQGCPCGGSCSSMPHAAIVKQGCQGGGSCCSMPHAAIVKKGCQCGGSCSSMHHPPAVKKGCQGGCGSCSSMPHPPAVKKGCQCGGSCSSMPHAAIVKKGCQGCCGSQGNASFPAPRISRQGNGIIIDLSNLKPHAQHAQQGGCSCDI